MKKYIKPSFIAIVAIIGIIALFPRGYIFAGDPTQSDSGASGSESSHVQESQATESNQQSLIKSQPIPSPLGYSNERQNLIDQLKVKGQQGLVGYVALIGPQGQLIAYYTIRGKVSSLNSYLTTTQQVIWRAYHSSASGVTVDSPDLDGSYGNNPQGIFFFTTANQYVEWSGNYLYSNQPMHYSVSPLIVSIQK